MQPNEYFQTIIKANLGIESGDDGIYCFFTVSKQLWRTKELGLISNISVNKEGRIKHINPSNSFQ